MFNKKITITSIVCLFLLFSVIPVLANEEPVVTDEEQFQPVISFHGNLTVTADSYSGIFPKKVLSESEREREEVAKMFALTDPTTIGFKQVISLEFYANPVPDLEVDFKLSHTGHWGGGGSSLDLGAPLFVEEAYARYYTNNAMYTVGHFKYDFDLLGLLLTTDMAARDGVSIHTMYKNIWITGIYNRLLMSPYDQYPYVSTYLLDELAALRFSRKVGTQFIGLNLLPDGFYDEIGISIDQSGKIFGKTVNSEIAAVRLAWVHRYTQNKDFDYVLDPDLGEARYRFGGMFAINAIETQNSLLTLRMGAFEKGFYPQYGRRHDLRAEGMIKLQPNMYGIDVLYQRALSASSVLLFNVSLMDFIDKKYQQKKATYPATRYAELKWQKYLSASTNLSLSINHIKEGQYVYSRAAAEWQTGF